MGWIHNVEFKRWQDKHVEESLGYGVGSWDQGFTVNGLQAFYMGRGNVGVMTSADRLSEMVGGTKETFDNRERQVGTNSRSYSEENKHYIAEHPI